MMCAVFMLNELKNIGALYNVVENPKPGDVLYTRGDHEKVTVVRVDVVVMTKAGVEKIVEHDGLCDMLWKGKR